MTAVQLLAHLRLQGFTLTPEGGHLRVTPKSALTPDIRETLAGRKEDLLTALALESRILKMPLERFEREGNPVEVRISWLPETLWFVPARGVEEIRVQRGVHRGRIWTSRELRQLLQRPLSSETIRAIALVKVHLEIAIESITECEEIPSADRLEEPDRIPTCQVCKGTQFWRSRSGFSICMVCHPPASPASVMEVRGVAGTTLGGPADAGRRLHD